MFGPKGAPSESTVCSNPIPSGTGGDTLGSQCSESGLGGAVWQHSIGNFSEQFTGFFEHSIFHGITTCTNK